MTTHHQIPGLDDRFTHGKLELGEEAGICVAACCAAGLGGGLVTPTLAFMQVSWRRKTCPQLGRPRQQSHSVNRGGLKLLEVGTEKGPSLRDQQCGSLMG